MRQQCPETAVQYMPHREGHVQCSGAALELNCLILYTLFIARGVQEVCCWERKNKGGMLAQFRFNQLSLLTVVISSLVVNADSSKI